MKKTVVLAMSGGVDSSVAAYLLKKKGYSVIGITLKVWPKNLCGKHPAQSCCSLEAINDAKSVCAKLGIPHYTIDCEKLFKKEVIDYFIKGYEEGLTPNPCIICNEKIKFPILVKKARQLGFGYIATGHHAGCIFNRRTKRYLVEEGLDKNKDQSYVLFSLSQDVLSRLILPIGDFKKDRIRAIAKRLGLRVADKKESQEICFILDNNLHRFLKENLGRKIKPGNIIDKEGKILGKSPGAIFFTVGQRRGLRIPYGRSIYVIEKRPATADIVVGEYKDTLKDKIIVNGVSWIDKVDITKPISGDVKIRYRHPKSKAVIRVLSPDRCEVDFLKPQSSPASGQAAVFYEKDRVIGGGWIE